MCSWFAGLIFEKITLISKLFFFEILSTTQGYLVKERLKWNISYFALYLRHRVCLGTHCLFVWRNQGEKERGTGSGAARRLRCTSARCSGAARGGVLAAAEQRSTYYEDMLMTWENVLKSYTATLYFILILLKLHFLPATCLSAHLMYSCCCFNKLTAAGSTANPTWFMGPALPFDPVPVGPLFPVKAVWVPSFLKAPVGQFLAQ